MKTMHHLTLVALLALGSQSSLFAQKMLGTYHTVACKMPKGYAPPSRDVVIEQDSRQQNVYWVKNLMASPIKAIKEAGSAYHIPAQQIGNYSVSFGCIVQSDNRVVVSLNNKADCPDITEGEFSVSEKGVSAPAVSVTPGGVSAPGAKVSRRGVAVNTKNLFPGVQFVGQKAGTRAADDDDDTK